jgi:hypothetical protein
MRSRPYFVGIVVALFAAACETHDPLARLGGCLNAPGGPTQGKPTAEVVCDVQRNVRLIAMPDPAPHEDDLLKLGVPRDGATLLQAGRDPGPHWCTLDQVPAPPPADWPKDRPLPATYRFEVECVPSRIQIRRPVVVQGSRFVLSLTSDATGHADLTDLRPAP